jgi:SAM-dependent methyltransferase
MDELRERGAGDGWRKLVADGVTATPVTLRRGAAVKLVDGAETEIVLRDDWPARLDSILTDARNVHLLSPEGDIHARRTKRGRWLVSNARPSSSAAVGDRHDREARHPLAEGHPLFRATKISRDKERQVQHYVELLRALPLWERDRIRVVDAGCGKAYMSLALVAYGREVGTRVELVGLDANADVIETVRGIAEHLGYDEASFEATTIADYAGGGPVDLLVSLHACDTASDEAIAAGVRLGAEAIVVAPCCHHELAGQLAKRTKDGVLRHGVLLGRQADLVTDALRASALETLGYRVDVIEFVATEHTPKNVMLRAERSPSATRAARARREYVALRDHWQVSPAIERLLGSIA